MSKVLMIRHLPATLSFQEKEQLLKHFGAEKVWQTRSKRNYVFASFSTVDMAKSSLTRLHQLEIAQRRLVVEYSNDSEPVTTEKTELEQNSETTNLIKKFLKNLNAWNSSIDFYQPPPAHFRYKYPDITPEIAVNIVHALFTHLPFYIQAVHLMNKMCLDVPFGTNTKSMDFFREKFKVFFGDKREAPVTQAASSEEESEISSAEDEVKKHWVQNIVKRKRKLPLPKNRPANMLLTHPPLPKVKKTVNQEDVFDTVALEPKKISINVHQDALQKPSEQPKAVGELGKFQKEEQFVEVNEKAEDPEPPTVTKRELLRNRISYSDMRILPIFKNYHPGEPSMRLYVKNLAKTVTEQDVKRIYKRYVESMTDEELTGFDVRVMQEGKMKGQAFVTFPSVEMAEAALNETNGYLLKERPMVVQFARAANKKTID